MTTTALSIYIGQMRRYPLLKKKVQAQAFERLQGDVVALWKHMGETQPAIRLRRTLERLKSTEGMPVVCPSRMAAGDLVLWAYERDADQAWLDAVVADVECAEARRCLADIEAQRRSLCQHNLALVVAWAQRIQIPEMPIVDRIQSGNIGLICAVRRFRCGKGAVFATYASWWIRHYITRDHDNHARMIRLPCHVGIKVATAYKVQLKLRADGKDASTEAVAKEIRVRPDQLRHFQRMHGLRVASMDAPLTDEDGGNLADVIPGDDPRDELIDNLSRQGEAKRVRALMAKALTPIEIDVLAQRFGFDGQGERTFSMVGKGVALSRERIRQIQNIALRKLRGAIRREENGL